MRSILLLAAAAQVALGAVANICASGPYHYMHHFKDYAPARAHCAAHYPVKVVTKTVQGRCRTTTRTHILRTETVTATRTYRCTSHTKKPDSSIYPVPTYHTPGYGHPPGYGGHNPGYGGHNPGYGHNNPGYGHNGGYGNHNGGYGGGYGGYRAHPRDAAPEPTDVAKRAEHGYAYEWDTYHRAMAKCGYECIQKACSCVAERKTVTRTEHAHCTKTKHTAAVITETSITHEGVRCTGYGAHNYTKKHPSPGYPGYGYGQGQ